MELQHTQPGRGLLPSGNCGGATGLFGRLLPERAAFFGGGGGGGFFPAGESGVAGGEGSFEAALVLIPPNRLAMPYFWFNPFALLSPDDTWSPCRSLKLLAVVAADLASDSDTEDGSFRKDCAVFMACCFCCHDVPWL